MWFHCLFSNPWDMLVLYRSSTCDHIVNHICLVCCLSKCSMLLDRCTCHKNWNVVNLIIRKYKYRKGLNWKSPTSTKITRGGVPYESYKMNASCALNWISMFLLNTSKCSCQFVQKHVMDTTFDIYVFIWQHTLIFKSWNGN
jgi:hypothetical protein